MGVGHKSRRGTINTSINNTVVNNISTNGVDLDSLGKFTTQALAQQSGLGVGDYFKYDIGSIEGIAGTIVQILELV